MDYFEKEGVSLKLSAEQEKLITSFLSFKKLKIAQLPNNMQHKARTYQKEGLSWLLFLYHHQLGGVLADDMGLGKTFQSIALLATIKEKQEKAKQKGCHLIVVPSSLVYNWAYEFERFCPDLTLNIYVGGQRSFTDQSDIIITSYDLLRRDAAVFENKQFDVLIFDEAQFLKNPQSARTQVAQRIKRQACFCLTGTPLENHIGEYVSILNTVLPGFLNQNLKQKWTDLENDSIQFITQRSKPFVLRRLKSQISHELQPKSEDIVKLSMSEKQLTVYNGLLTTAKKQMSQKRGIQNSNLLC